MAVQAPLSAAATRFDVPKGATPRVAWELALPSGAQERLACGLSDLLLRRLCTAYSLWWTRDEPGVGSSLLISEGLPAIERYAAMLDGDWNGWGWTRCQPLSSHCDDAPAADS
jgi:type VI secretion system protein ImpM